MFLLESQKQHVELTRNIVSVSTTNMVLPLKCLDLLFQKQERVLKLAKSKMKMSKSDSDSRGCILLLDEECYS